MYLMCESSPFLLKRLPHNRARDPWSPPLRICQHNFGYSEGSAHHPRHSVLCAFPHRHLCTRVRHLPNESPPCHRPNIYILTLFFVAGMFYEGITCYSGIYEVRWS